MAGVKPKPTGHPGKEILGSSLLPHLPWKATLGGSVTYLPNGFLLPSGNVKVHPDITELYLSKHFTWSIPLELPLAEAVVYLPNVFLPFWGSVAYLLKRLPPCFR